MVNSKGEPHQVRQVTLTTCAGISACPAIVCT